MRTQGSLKLFLFIKMLDQLQISEVERMLEGFRPCEFKDQFII